MEREGVIRDPSDIGQVCPDKYPSAGKDLQRDAAGNADGRCQPSGEMSSAPHIGCSTPFYGCGVVRMGWPGCVFEALVIARALVCVADDGSKGRTGKDVIPYTAEKFRQVGFFPCGGQFAVPGRPPCQEAAQFFKIDGRSRGKAVNHNADRWAVGFTENADTQIFAKFRGHEILLSRLRGLQKRWGMIC